MPDPLPSCASRMIPARLNGSILSNILCRLRHGGECTGGVAAVQVQAAESGSGPNEPIDWAVVFMAEGHHRNVNDDKDDS
jgi:hypothetical protein